MSNLRWHTLFFVGVKQGSSALPAFDLYGIKGKAGETFALPLRNLVNIRPNPAEAGRYEF